MLVSLKQLSGTKRDMGRIFVLYSRNKNDFNLRKRAAGDNATIIGGWSSTIGNARDLVRKSYDDAIIITSGYHVPRVELVMSHFGVSNEVVSAEKILGLTSRRSLTEPIKMLLTIVYIRIQDLIHGKKDANRFNKEI